MNAFKIEGKKIYRHKVMKSLGGWRAEKAGEQGSPHLWPVSEESGLPLEASGSSVKKAWGWTVVIFPEHYWILPWALSLIDFPTADHKYSQKWGTLEVHGAPGERAMPDESGRGARPH